MFVKEFNNLKTEHRINEPVPDKKSSCVMQLHVRHQV